jgi:hypothetical protein
MTDVKQNFGSILRENMWCRTCFVFNESHEHLLKCSAITERLEKNVDFSILRYSMLFGKPEEQVDITRVFSLIFKTREEMLDERKSP